MSLMLRFVVLKFEKRKLFIQWPLINSVFIISKVMIMDPKLGRAKRKTVVTDFELSRND